MKPEHNRARLANGTVQSASAIALDTQALMRQLPLSISSEALSVQQRSPTPPAELTPDQALHRLIEGNHRFITHRPQNPNQSLARVTEIAEKQKPFATVLGCSDSRVPLEIIFDQGLGDIFVIRVAGNIVTPVEMGSIEYGTAMLGSKVLMVLGHSHCGAVSATLNGGHLIGQIDRLTEAIQPAVARSKGQSGDALENAVKANVFLQMERLLASPVVARLVDEGQLKLVGGYYNLDSGKVSILSVYPCRVPKVRSVVSEKTPKREKLKISEIRYMSGLTRRSSPSIVVKHGCVSKS
jgi:carbonic anhydrase